eukprot:TRINITY_DN26857_c0_g1_i1.p1 TRINITY_DN26857_c0_g1~~TRINITY_DN26857_c0_g1_i1.p1  ORF type:complete len:572 (+),score=42.37 TRINITY_DN26857_c0_g1_i1:205-1920(+)
MPKSGPLCPTIQHPVNPVRIGKRGSLTYRVLFTDHTHCLLSPLHDIPLTTPLGGFSFVCTTPAGSWVRHTVARSEPSHPLSVEAEAFAAVPPIAAPPRSSLGQAIHVPDDSRWHPVPQSPSEDNFDEDVLINMAFPKDATRGFPASFSPSPPQESFSRFRLLSPNPLRSPYSDHSGGSGSTCSSPYLTRSRSTHAGNMSSSASVDALLGLSVADNSASPARSGTSPSPHRESSPKPAHFKENSPWCIGFLPQTSTSHPGPPRTRSPPGRAKFSPRARSRSDKAGPWPLQVVDLSHEKVRLPGDVYEVKPLALFTRVGGYQSASTLLVVATDDPLAASLEDGSSVQKHLPGTLQQIKAWLEDNSNLRSECSDFRFKIETQLAPATSEISRSHENWRSHFELAASRTAPVVPPSVDPKTLTRVWETYTSGSSAHAIPLSGPRYAEFSLDSLVLEEPPKQSADSEVRFLRRAFSTREQRPQVSRTPRAAPRANTLSPRPASKSPTSKARSPEQPEAPLRRRSSMEMFEPKLTKIKKNIADFLHTSRTQGRSRSQPFAGTFTLKAEDGTAQAPAA